jgi:hypothetical protein
VIVVVVAVEAAVDTSAAVDETVAAAAAAAAAVVVVAAAAFGNSTAVDLRSCTTDDKEHLDVYTVVDATKTVLDNSQTVEGCKACSLKVEVARLAASCYGAAVAETVDFASRLEKKRIYYQTNTIKITIKI